MHPGLASGATAAIPLHAVTARDARAWLAKDKQRRLLSATGFTGAAGQLMAAAQCQRRDPGLGAGAGRRQGCFCAGAGGRKACPTGPTGWARCRIFAAAPMPRWPGSWAAMSSTATRRKRGPHAKLVIPQGVDGAEISRIAKYLFLARDLVNTPPNDMGPAELAAAARALARSAWRKILASSAARR